MFYLRSILKFMSGPGVFFFILWVLFATLLQPTPLFADGNGRGDILILHSYHSGDSRTDGLMAGMQEILLEKAGEFQVHVEYLDTERYQKADYFATVLDSILHYKLKGKSFDLVLLSDHEALNFALEHRNDFFADTPIVFCGISNFKPEMISGLNGITGVAESPAFRETIELALRLHPKTEEIVVIGNTRNVTDLDNRESLTAALGRLDTPVRFTFWDDLPLEEVTGMLGDLPERRLVLINGSVTDNSGNPLPFSYSMKRMRVASPVPLYGLSDYLIGKGIVGGKLSSARMQGRLAAKMALRVLQGEDPDEIPVITGDASEFIFDYEELERAGISVGALPEGGKIINRPPPFYLLSKGQLWAGLGAMTGLTAFLLFNFLSRRKAEKALRESEAQVTLLLNSTAEAIYGLDLQGRCTFCNPAALRLLGYEAKEDLLGKNIHALIHHTRPDGTYYPEEECRICYAFRKNEGFHFEDEVLWRSDGKSFAAEYWSYPLRKKKKPIGAVVTFLDITERREAEENLKEANRELGAFVYTVSHDLRTPLTAIIGFTEFLKMEYGDYLDETVLDILTNIENAGLRMAALTEDLLALAKVGSLGRPPEPVDTDAVVKEVLQELGSQLSSAGIAAAKGELPELRVPETLLAQVFENLIGNALRYAGRDGGPIEVGGERSGDRVRLFVRDHGPGIPAEERSRIFEVFYRGSTGKTVQGTGVGLATVQKIARCYGGRAWAGETPGGGATFWVELQDPLSRKKKGGGDRLSSRPPAASTVNLE